MLYNVGKIYSCDTAISEICILGLTAHRDRYRRGVRQTTGVHTGGHNYFVVRKLKQKKGIRP